MNSAAAEAAMTRWTGDAMQSRLRKRYRSERLFKLLGFAAVGISLAFLAFLLGTMLWKGAGGLSLGFLTMSDSTDPATAGVWGSLKGSFLTILVTMALAFPVGVLSAIYLRVLSSWLRGRDEGTDRVMADLDRALARAERFAEGLGRGPRNWRVRSEERGAPEAPRPANP